MISLKHSFNLRYLVSQTVGFKKTLFFPDTKHLSTKTKEGSEIVPVFEDVLDTEEETLKEAALEEKRNKSNLRPQDYRIQHGMTPYSEPKTDYHEYLRYKRRMYGKYGESSKVNPSILWPSTKELNAMKEFITVRQPYTIHQLINRLKERKEDKINMRINMENEVLKKVANVKEEIIEFHKRVAKQKKEIMELKEKKKQLIDELRREVGYDFDPRDEKFAAMIEAKEKEQKKFAKQAKKAEKEAKAKAFKENILKFGAHTKEKHTEEE